TSWEACSLLRGTDSALVPAQRGEWEDHPVQVVVDVEVTGKSSAGELRFVPATVRSLRAHEVIDPMSYRVRAVPVDRQQRQQRPRGLRGGGVAVSDPGRVVVGAQILTPSAVRVLVLLQP